MKYVAFESTPNEQIFNSEEHTITFVNSPVIVKDVIAVFGNGTWKKFNESKKTEE